MSTFARFSNEWVSPRPRTCAPPGRTCQIEGQHKRRVAEPEESLLADGSIPLRPVGVLRHSPWDALFIALALAHGLALIEFPSIPLIAIGFWWNANTIAHNFIHLPYFRSRKGNALFAAWESLLLGIPQRLWRERHLAHHAGRQWHWRWSGQLAWESFLVLALWGVLLALAPKFFLTVYLPGWLLGLGLCQLQGFFEHEHGTTSHYGRLYNLLFFNDGFHVEQHAPPPAPAAGRPCCAGSSISASMAWNNWCCTRRHCNGSCCEITSAPCADCCPNWRTFAGWKSSGAECFPARR